MESHTDRNKPLTDRGALRRLAGWGMRSCTALLADLKLVDCGSLDVLLYCTDDVAVMERRDLDTDRSSS